MVFINSVASRNKNVPSIYDNCQLSLYESFLRDATVKRVRVDEAYIIDKTNRTKESVVGS